MPDVLVPVPVGACRCDGTPHPDGDIVFLHPNLSMNGGLAAQAAMWIDDPVQRGVALYGAMIDHGIADWTFVDPKGATFEINPERIREFLPWGEGGSEVSRKAAELYGGSVATPFARLMEQVRTRTGSSSPTGPTAASTSPTRSTKRQRRGH